MDCKNILDKMAASSKLSLQYYGAIVILYSFKNYDILQ